MFSNTVRFPLDHKDNFPLQHGLKNHSTANQHERDIEAYLQEEKRFGAIFGPFETCPLKICTSPPS